MYLLQCGCRGWSEEVLPAVSVIVAVIVASGATSTAIPEAILVIR